MKHPLFLSGCCAVICATALLPTSAHAELVVDQSQTTAESFSDLSSGNQSGQTFTVGMTGNLVGLRLRLMGRTHSGGTPGSEFIVSLRKTVDGVPEQEILTTGRLTRRYVPVGGAGWVNVRFDPPYQAAAGEVLAFTVEGVSDGGKFGYNVWGMAGGNPYPGGQMFYGFTPEEPLSTKEGSYDLAFQTIVSDGEEDGVFPQNVDYVRLGALNAQIAKHQTRIKKLQKQAKTKALQRKIQALRRQIRELRQQIATESQLQ